MTRHEEEQVNDLVYVVLHFSIIIRLRMAYV
jgi:hypothetical protein